MTQRSGHESRYWLLLLLLITLIPRALLAWRRETICSDAVFMVERGQALARGDFAAGFADLGLNLYTLLLALADASGFEPALFGRWLSVCAASLTVVPLALLTADWFGRRAAVIAGLLYAFSPEALDWSAEAIRDPLFWLAFAWGIRAAWRASITLTFRDHLVWGMAFATALLLRSEGALLILPLALWQASLRGSWHMAARASAGVSVWAAAMVAINVALLTAGHERLELGRLDHARIVARLSRATVGAAQATPAPSPLNTSPTTTSTTAAAGGERPKPSWRELTWAVRHNVLRGLGWPCVALTTLGVLALDRHGRRRILALALVSVALVAAMGAYFWHYHELTTRYVVTLQLVVMPLAGHGGATLLQCGAALIGSRHAARRVAAATTLGALVLVCAQGAADGFGRANESRALKKSLGQHLAARYGPGQTLLATENLERLVGYYALARHQKLPHEVRGIEALDWLRIKQPALVVLWTRERPERYAELLAAPYCLGYDREQLPVEFRDAVLLVRRDVARRGGAAGVACQTDPHSYTSVALARPGRGPRTARR